MFRLFFLLPLVVEALAATDRWHSAPKID